VRREAGTQGRKKSLKPEATQTPVPKERAKGNRAARRSIATTPHEGSKTAQVVAMPPAEERSHSGP